VYPMISGRSRMPGHDMDMDMHSSTKSEAMQKEGVHDTVMGNTGMLLLEDPGLQAFVPQAFAPLTWALAPGPELEAHMRVKEENDAKQSWLSMEALRAASRSSEQGSAPRSAYASQEQPQGPTSPTSPFAVEQRRKSELGRQQLPPHRHHSYPSHDAIPAAVPSLPNRQRASGQTAELFSPQDDQDAGRERVWDEGTDTTRFMPRFATSQQLHTLPESAVTSRPVAQPNPNVHPSWAARPAIPNSSFSDPVLNHAHQMAGRGQTMPNYTQPNMPMPSWQYTLPFSLSSASGEGVTATAEQMHYENWRRSYIGSNNSAGQS
jgi:hypothetical protein